MFRGTWESFREGIFGMFYVMTEQSNRHGKLSRWGVIQQSALYFIDAGQVLRALIIPEFGWSPEMGSFMNNFDIVLAMFSLVPHPMIPSILTFIVSVSLVVLVIADAALVRHIFQKGKTSQLWPIVILRFLVTTMVTTFFIAIFRYLLFPINCSLNGNTLSNVLQGDDAACSPWTSPAVFVTIPSMLLAIVFAIFSLTVTLLGFEVNPLSLDAKDCCTGRVEALWSGTRILIAILRYVQKYITPIGALVLVGIQVLFMLYYHIKTLPFHNHEFNMLRGGIYLAVFWLIASSFVTISNSGSNGQFQEGQWGLIAAIPFVFFIGAHFAEGKKKSILKNLKRLRCEFLKETATEPKTDSITIRDVSSGRPDQQAKRRTAYEDFFASDSTLLRAFDNSDAAHIAIRILLYEKDERDIAFLGFLMRRALAEHPDSKNLSVLNLVFLRFVFRDKQSSMWQETAAKLGSIDLPIDLKYTLYAVDRKAFQRDAGLSLGKEGISAINLMEFSGKMAHARKMHLECIVLHKGLWKTALKCKHHNSLAAANEMITSFSKVSEAVYHTQQCYEELIEKFPASASLRLDYANFCDIVLNDLAKAEHHTHKADLLETGDSGDITAPDLERADAQTAPRTGSCTSSVASYRSQQTQYMLSWSQSVMHSQVLALGRLNLAILGLGFLLMLVSTCGFLVLEYYLYLNVMVERLSFLERAKNFRLDLFTSLYEMRNLHLLANNTIITPEIAAAIQNSRDTMMNLSTTIGKLHSLNYVASPSPAITAFFLSPTQSLKQWVAGVGEIRENITFWDQGNAYLLAISMASQMSIEDLRNPNADLSTQSSARSAAVFMYENAYSFTAAVKEFLELIIVEIQNVKSITDTIVEALLTVETGLIIFISLIILRYVTSVFPTCQHSAVGSNLVDSLPTPTIRKMLKFYVKNEKNMSLIEDELAAKKALELANDFPDEDMRSQGADGVRCALVSSPIPSNVKQQLSIRSTHRNMFEMQEIRRVQSMAMARRSSRRPSIIDRRANGVQASNEGANCVDLRADGLQRTISLDEVGISVQAHKAPMQAENEQPNFLPLTCSNVQHHMHSTSAASLLSSSTDTSLLSPARRLMTMNTECLSGNPFQRCGSLTPENGVVRLAHEEQVLQPMQVARLEDDQNFTARHGHDPDNVIDSLCSDTRNNVDDHSVSSPIAAAARMQGRTSPCPSVASVFSSAHSEMMGSFLSKSNDVRNHPNGCEIAFQGTSARDAAWHNDVTLALTEINQESNLSERSFDDADGLIWQWSRLARLMLIDARSKERLEHGTTSRLQKTNVDSDPMYSEVAPLCSDSQERSSENFVFGLPIFSVLRNIGIVSSKKLDPMPDSTNLANNDGCSFTDNVEKATSMNLAWYFRGSTYVFCSLLVLVLCFCVWLIPTRIVPDLINTTLLVNQVRSISANTMESLFLLRELVLADGFSQQTPMQIMQLLTNVVNENNVGLLSLRLGGDDNVHTGADKIDSDIMMQYKNAMYQDGCPWRADPSTCRNSLVVGNGLYRILVVFEAYISGLAGGFAPSQTQASTPSSSVYPFAHVELQPARVQALTSVGELAFLLNQYNGDIFQGLAWLENVFYQQEGEYFANMQQENNILLSLYIIMVIGVFYFLTFRTALSQARNEVDRTRHFVSAMPAYILTREETAMVRHFFVRKGDCEETDEQHDFV